MTPPPLIGGGQGRSPRDVDEAAKVLAAFMIAGMVLLVVLAVAQRLTR